MNKENNNCLGRADDIVAYMYGELGLADRSRFEAHLADCTSCIDEFASVSQARFSVYEWHKEEFAPLATPEFLIPYAPASQPSAGIFAALGEMIRGAGWPAAAAAALVLSIGIVFAAMTFIGTGEGEIARVEVESEQQVAARATFTGSPQAVEPAIESTEVEPVSVAIKTHSTAAPARNAKRTTRRSTSERNRLSTPVMSKAPVLSNYEDNEDRSLRLADLLNEVGG